MSKHRVTVTFDRDEGSNIEESKATIEQAVALLKPMKAKLRFRMTHAQPMIGHKSNRMAQYYAGGAAK
jgi:hypothetical protein